ncbi:hypothetical protein H0E87_026317 [Populus deltoides]|uniref:Uncharacterized protein n=1 Tax=Populus deltoides TaxID=3696 RepID=A0A8T2X273_POPDE|nr:hypothetical protein H0E87_026317 [Populus deltoides]
MAFSFNCVYYVEFLFLGSMGELENYLVPIFPGDAYASTMPCQLRVHLMIMKPVSKLLVYTGVIDKSSLSGLPKFDWMPIGTGRMGM